METIAEKLKYREDTLLVAKDMELEHRWDLAMKLRMDVSINLGWYQLWLDISHLEIFAQHPYDNDRLRINRLIGSTSRQIYGKLLEAGVTREHHVALLETSNSSFVTVRFSVFDSRIWFNVPDADDLMQQAYWDHRSPRNQARPQIPRGRYASGVDGWLVTYWRTAGDALKSLSDEERERMEWR